MLKAFIVKKGDKNKKPEEILKDVKSKNEEKSYKARMTPLDMSIHNNENFIKNLASENLSGKQIQKLLKQDYHENISLNYIDSIINSGKSAITNYHQNGKRRPNTELCKENY